MPIASLSSNPWKLLALKAGSSALFYLPILVVFLQNTGMTLQEVLVLQGISAFVLAAWQVPSGYVADRWGRRNTIIAGAVINCIGILCYCIGNNYWFFLAGTSLLSTGLSFQSGTLEAMTYETLEAAGRHGTFRKVMGRQTFIRFATEACSGIIGGLLALLSLRAPFWAALPIFLALVPLSCTLVEPPRDPSKERARPLRDMARILKLSLIDDRRLRWVILFDSVIGPLCITLFWFTQPYQVAAGLPLGLFGVSHAAVVLMGALAAKEAHRVSTHFSDYRFFLLIAVGVVCCYIALGSLQPWLGGLVLIVALRFLWGFIYPLTFDLISRMTTPDIRATVLSIRGMGFQLLFGALPPLFGIIVERTSLTSGFLALGLTTAIVAAVLLGGMRGVWKEMPTENGQCKT